MAAERRPVNTDVIWECSPKPFAQLFLAHGSNTDMESEFMTFVAKELSKQGISVARFNFPFAQRNCKPGKRKRLKIDDKK